MTPVSSKAQAILDAAVDAQAVDPARMSANLSAVEARISAGDLGPELGPETMPPSGAPSAGAIGAGAKVAGALLLVGAIGLALRPRETPEPRTPAPAVSVPAVATATTHNSTPLPQTSSEPALEDLAPEDGSDREPVASVQIRTKPQVKADPSKRPKVVSADDSSIDRLEEEMALMSEARRALGRGDARKALELLNKHGREFPKGEFQRERVVSRVTALCALGQKDAARRVAKRYLEKDSSSVHAQRISQTCAASD